MQKVITLNLEPKCLICVYLGKNLKKGWSDLKSAPSKYAKMKKKGPKVPYLSILELEFEKAIVVFEISTHEFIKNELLTKLVNFGVVPAFLKVEDLLFLKVCVLMGTVL